MTTENSNCSECCPPFSPELWDDKLTEWQNKSFIKDKISTLFYIPLGFGKVMTRLEKLVREAGESMPDWLCLSEHVSMWRMNVYLAVDKEIPQAENVRISGQFYTKVYEGPFKDTGKWSKDFQSTLKTKGFKTVRTFYWYTTCPKCAKKYGKNYVVLVAELEKK